MFYLQNKFPSCLDLNSFSEKDKKELKVTTRMNKIDWNDTSQTSHRWTDDWRPSQIIAYHGQETSKTSQNIGPDGLTKKIP